MQTQLRERYRLRIGSHFQDDQERLVYLLARMPQTSLVIETLLKSLQRVLPEVHTLRDFGAGPATTMWALDGLEWALERVDLIERDHGMRSLGVQLLKNHKNLKTGLMNWFSSINDVSHSSVDVSMASYSLGELAKQERLLVLNKLWQHTHHALVIIEPGSPQGFNVIKGLREALMAMGAHVLSPCPHQASCPMPSNDWCHFKINCVRPSFVKHIKHIKLGYEEENYSYVIALKKPLGCSSLRVIKAPVKRAGHVSLDLCAPDGLKRITVSKKDRDFYKYARKVQWGDVLETDLLETKNG